MINKVLENIRKKLQKEKQSDSDKACPICMGTGMELVKDNIYRKCKCSKLEHVKELWKKSDMGYDFLDKNFKSYNPVTVDQKHMKDLATSYFLEFDNIKNSISNSIMLLGQSGSGKTHLLTATAYKLIEEKGIGVVYMSFVESLTKLKQLKVNDTCKYQKSINKYKNAKVLFIDDLFKGKITEADILITFEIINYRINKRLPMMISSERSILELKNFDNAIAGRMFNASKRFVMEIWGENNDYRLKNYYKVTRG
ncbi:ATP-binding protein [Clostridium chrysemydis]|uniref:ATP-binding protein n=1 Tax=Clostridium chrysemydis TaxID=2665504 RepID=UPI003F31619A